MLEKATRDAGGFQKYVDMFIEFAGENPYIILASGALGVIIPIAICLMVPSGPVAVEVKEKQEEKQEEKKEEVVKKEGEEEKTVTKRKVRKEDD